MLLSEEILSTASGIEKHDLRAVANVFEAASSSARERITKDDSGFRTECEMRDINSVNGIHIRQVSRVLHPVDLNNRIREYVDAS